MRPQFSYHQVTEPIWSIIRKVLVIGTMLALHQHFPGVSYMFVHRQPRHMEAPSLQFSVQFPNMILSIDRLFRLLSAVLLLLLESCNARCEFQPVIKGVHRDSRH